MQGVPNNRAPFFLKVTLGDVVSNRIGDALNCD